MAKDWVLWGLETAAKGVVAPMIAAVDFVTNGGEFSDEGKEHAINAITPGIGDIDDILSDN